MFHRGFAACDGYTGGEAAMEKVQCPVLFLLGKADAMTPPKAAHSLQQKARHGRTVLVDPKGDDYEKYRGASILTPNQGEFRAVVGGWRDEADFERRGHALRERLELDALLITRSEEGASLFLPGEVVHVKAEAREVFDVSGAGDTVIATLAAMLGAAVEIREAVRWANRAAGIVVGKLGAAVVTPDELLS